MKRLTTIASVVATILILAGIGFYAGLFGGAKEEATAEAEVMGTATVTTTEATQGSLSPTAIAYGSVSSSPQNSFVIQIPRDGVFKTVNVRDGDAVRSGQPIVTVVTAAANATAYEQAKSAVTFATRAVELATRDDQRIERQFGEKLATNDQVSTARKGVEDAEKALEDAKIQLDAQSKIGAGAGEETIRAPFDGIVTGLMAVPGDKVQANNTIATIVSRSNLTVELNLEPEDAAKLAPGAAVKLTNTFGGDQIEGKLRSIGASVDPMTHTVKALCDVPAAMAAKIALGATLVARIELPPKQGILVPRTALLEDSSGPYIFTIAEDTAHKQNVKVLVETEDMALIDGVDPALGTKVVVNNSTELDDDTPVEEAKS
jgi:RND family efflux transporter MFP subunit